MVDRLHHRGPDGRGQQVIAPQHLPYAVGLGHTRLAILDLSTAGLQPMANADQSAWISYNGEVYNFQSHRRALEEQGYRFRSHTDTEVLLHLYQEHGEEFLQMLNGMFALAILDTQNQQLLLARDPIGIKPLYYYHQGGRFVFASEIKAILASELYTTEVDWQAAYDYFTYLYIPCPQTMFRDIRQLPPGHVLKLDLRTGQVQTSAYWQVRRLPDIETASEAELQERANHLLTQAVSAQLISDVPLGIFLSGGIDSTTVAGLACETSQNVKTFTAVFEGHDFQYFNEQAVASAISRHLGAEHHEITVPTTDLWSMFDLLEYFDQPFGNPTFYLMYLVSKNSRDQITVALCGAGGDELYAGYPRYKAARLARRLGWVPAPLWRLGGRALGVLRDNGRTPLLRRARQFVSGMPLEDVERFAHWTYFMGSAEKERLLTGRGATLCNWERSERVLRQVLGNSPLAEADNRLLHLDVTTFLVDNLLEYTDKMSMAVSLESRVPLLDHDFVEFSLNVPYRFKMNGGRTKVLLRDVFSRFLPPAARRAPKKGFNAPLSHWMRNTLDDYFEASQHDRHPLKDRLGADIGTTWQDEGVLNWSFIQHLRQQHRNGKADFSYELFSILVFDLWWRKYVRCSG
jgi:asparagine synthase (glutamine-hydrolysing)